MQDADEITLKTGLYAIRDGRVIMNGRRDKSTSTSTFGSPGRHSHDSARFYSGKLYSTAKGGHVEDQAENPMPHTVLDRVFLKSAESMEEIPDSSVHLMVTSPPYNVGKAYDRDLTLKEHLEFLRSVWAEVYRVLVVGGRACINVANLGRKPYIPMHSHVIEGLESLGFLMRGEIIWNKSASAGSSTAWGTWRSAANPVIRDVHEYILLFSKGSYSRKGKGKESTMSSEEFLEYTRSIWNMPAEQANAVGHPAPFPVELPYRLIQLYTFHGDIILDPFMGSGQSAIAAIRAGRRFVGYENVQEYVDLASERIKRELMKKGEPRKKSASDAADTVRRRG